VKGTFSGDGSLKAVGLSCAVCHSTVDDAFMHPNSVRRLSLKEALRVSCRS
jgi:hypothetical protein